MKKYIIIAYLFATNTFGTLFNIATYQTNLSSSWLSMLQKINRSPSNIIFHPLATINDLITDKTEIIAERFVTQDVVAFQGINNPIDNDNLTDAMFRKGFCYFTARTGEDFRQLFKGVLVSGGVKIFSKHPIEEVDYLVFPSIYEQYLSSKGAVYAQINFYNKIIHVFSLHAQSSHKDYINDFQLDKNCRNQRKIQLDYLKKFIDKQNIPEGSLIILIGNFNINNEEIITKPIQLKNMEMEVDHHLHTLHNLWVESNFEEKNKEFDEMLHFLSAQNAGRSDNSLLFSLDTQNNTLASRNYPYTRANLDHILFITKTNEVISPLNHPLIVRNHFISENTKIWIEKLEDANGEDLSDHNPVFMQTDLTSYYNIN